MKPGLITLTNEICKSKGLNEMWIDSDDNNYLKKYWQEEDDKRIKPQHENGGKVTVELKWSIQEGADEPAAAKYADGKTDDVNAEWGDRVKKAREQGVETTYMTHIPSQLLRAQNDQLGRGNEAWQITLMTRDELKAGRVGRIIWLDAYRKLNASWDNAVNMDNVASVRALVI